jgi:hypothetical protein
MSASELLAAIELLVKKNSFAEALALSAELNIVVPRNTFVIGLHKQLEAILSANENGIAPQSLCKPLFPLIVRARDSATIPTAAKSSASTKSADEANRKRAIVELKSRYLTLADGLMKKGDFEGALLEVRRVQMIDDADETAKAYGEKLEELIALYEKPKVMSEKQPEAKETIVEHYEPPASLNQLVTMTQTDFDSIVSKTVQPQAPLFPDATPTLVNFHAEPMQEHKRKSWTSLLMGSAFFIVLGIAASYYMTTMNTSAKENSEKPNVEQQKLAAANPSAESNRHLTTTPRDSLNAGARADSLQTQN